MFTRRLSAMRVSWLVVILRHGHNREAKLEHVCVNVVCLDTCMWFTEFNVQVNLQSKHEASKMRFK